MKLITAVIQPGKLHEVIDAVVGVGARGLTVAEVRGFGQQYGRLPSHQQARWDPQWQAALLPKARMDIVVPDDLAELVAETIAKCANTGTIGDGKVWVGSVDSVLRVRTGECDEAAL